MQPVEQFFGSKNLDVALDLVEEKQNANIAIQFQDGEKPLSLPDFVHLAASSSFVFTQLSNGDLIHLPLCLSKTVQKIISFLKGKTTFLSKQELPSFMCSVSYLLFDEKAINAFLPAYSQLSFEDLVLHMNLFPNNKDIDAILAQSLRSKNMASSFLSPSENEVFDELLMAVLSRFKDDIGSEVHQEFRKTFSFLILNGGLNERLVRLDPPIELDVSPRNIDLLEKNEIFNRLTHCTITEGTKQFYLRALSKLLSKPLAELSVQDEHFLQKVQQEYGNNDIVIRACIKKNGSALQFASQEFKDNEDMVLLAVIRNGSALQFAGDELKNNRTIVSEAIKQSWKAFAFASADLQNSEQMRRILIQRWKHKASYDQQLQCFFIQRGIYH